MQKAKQEKLGKLKTRINDLTDEIAQKTKDEDLTKEDSQAQLKLKQAELFALNTLTTCDALESMLNAQTKPEIDAAAEKIPPEIKAAADTLAKETAEKEAEAKATAEAAEKTAATEKAEKEQYEKNANTHLSVKSTDRVGEFKARIGTDSSGISRGYVPLDDKGEINREHTNFKNLKEDSEKTIDTRGQSQGSTVCSGKDAIKQDQEAKFKNIGLRGPNKNETENTAHVSYYAFKDSGEEKSITVQTSLNKAETKLSMDGIGEKGPLTAAEKKAIELMSVEAAVTAHLAGNKSPFLLTGNPTSEKDRYATDCMHQALRRLNPSAEIINKVSRPSDIASFGKKGFFERDATFKNRVTFNNPESNNLLDMNTHKDVIQKYKEAVKNLPIAESKRPREDAVGNKPADPNNGP